MDTHSTVSLDGKAAKGEVCNRDTSAIVYPKLRTLSSSGSAIDSESDDDLDSFTSILNASYVKRTSGRHLLAQFTEVEIAALQQTEVAKSLEQQKEQHDYSGETLDDTLADVVSQMQSGKVDLTDGVLAVVTKENESESSPEVDGDRPASDDDPEVQIRETLEDKSSQDVGLAADNQVSATASYHDAISSADKISFPFKTRQELHITYNVKHARYEGLPAAWRVLNHQFGLPLEAVPKRSVDGYEDKIPAVLQMMKEYLLANNGTELEGIFRLAPDKDECNAAKEAINSGSFSGCSDIHIIANLIKV